MPSLDAVGIHRTVATWMRENTSETAFTKAELLAAAQAAHQWVNDNTAAYSAALPAAFRQKATNEQRAELLGFILARMIGRLRATEDT